ncbi:MAG: pyruvate formate-lyase-activating protein [Oscillospiraceae bacterium]|nr:pyruvate formate-lyase-activating protein [Oscillospiraceae bacterium]MDD7429881.1 pyruvate formate-lyase-activating protein [Oscillospiraceae bacterium]MDY2848512.1 pyruvate formate-lyase-activating protein [Oscillospiraceae bacterium]
MENTSAVGRIHSTESFGAADGPGVRYIIFMQGCDMRCRYCHNPDTWDKSRGTEITAEQALKQALRYRSYWKKGGGITVSGGEPLLQTDFLTELFRLAKAENVSTCIDTAGQPFTREEPFFSKFNELMKYTDLLLLDIKEISSERHRNVTGHDNANILDMARYLSDIGKPVWIRHVLVPTLSDFDEDIDGLRKFLDTLKNVERVEILPYHTLGRFKWDELGIKYPLEGVEPPSEERIFNAKKRLGIL